LLRVDVDGALKMVWNHPPRQNRVFIDESAPLWPVSELKASEDGIRPVPVKNWVKLFSAPK